MQQQALIDALNKVLILPDDPPIPVEPEVKDGTAGPDRRPE